MFGYEYIENFHQLILSNAIQTKQVSCTDNLTRTLAPSQLLKIIIITSNKMTLSSPFSFSDHRPRQILACSIDF